MYDVKCFDVVVFDTECFDIVVFDVECFDVVVSDVECNVSLAVNWTLTCDLFTSVSPL